MIEHEIIDQEKILHKMNDEIEKSNSTSNQFNCIHDWNEVRVWSFGATYIRYCNKCHAKETFIKQGKK